MLKSDYLAAMRWLFLSACIVLIYFFLAKFGLGWSDFTSGITLVWPAAGLALFSCMRWGIKILPAIFIGSLLATQLLHFNKIFTFELKYLFLAACMATADCLQALLIAKVNRALHLRTFKVSILRLIPFVVSVFSGCLISSSIGTFILHTLDIVTTDALQTNWLFWWMGDSAGMLLFGPLFFWIFLLHQSDNHPKARAFLLLSAVTGIAIFVMASLSYIDNHQQEQKNKSLADRFQIALDNRLELSLRDLDVLNRFYYKIYPTAKDFDEVSQPLRERSPWISQLIWLPDVALRRTELEGSWISGTNESSADTIDTLKTILESGHDTRKIFSSQVDLSSRQLNPIYIFQPVESCLSHQKNCAFRGWVVARVEVQEWFNHALQQMNGDYKKLVLRIKNQNQINLWRVSNKRWTPVSAEKSGKNFKFNFTWQLFDQTLDVSIYSSSKSNLPFSWLQMVGFIFCSLVICLLIAYVYAQQRHDDLVANNQSKLRKEIALQTSSLRQANESLVKEISERKAAQELLQKSQAELRELVDALQIARDKAEEATLAKSRFLANMSHEIRTPLNAVLGYTQLLMRDKDINEKHQDKLSAILTSGHKLLGLINDILDLSKIESGAIHLKNDYFDLHQEISTVQTVVSDRAKIKGLPLNVNVDLKRPFIVNADRQKLGQILINLLSNAIKFTQDGSISLDVRETSHAIEFCVTDTGSGIAAKELSELFVAFKQGTAGEQMGGTGLGLALSRRLAEAMGGNLDLQSQQGVGTKAILCLPLAEEAVEIKDQFFSARQDLSFINPPKILVVEDDFASNNILVNLLIDAGCQVQSAADGREALHKAFAENFDLIFTDIRMPDINGLELLSQLRQNPNYKHTPVIAVSASSLEHERNYYLEQGFQHFIGKPYSFDDIYLALIDFAGAQASEVTPVEMRNKPIISSDIDLKTLTRELEMLLAYAVKGDMTNCKRLVADLNEMKLGFDAYYQLSSAIKGYDLERVEALIKSWLGQ